MNNSACNLGALLLRVISGSMMFILHGASKIKMIADGNFGDFPNPIGLGSAMSLYLSGITETLFALFLVIGLFTRFSAFLLSFNMLVALYWLDSTGSSGGELALLYFGMYLLILLFGGGNISFDNFIERWKSSKK